MYLLDFDLSIDEPTLLRTFAPFLRTSLGLAATQRPPAAQKTPVPRSVPVADQSAPAPETVPAPAVASVAVPTTAPAPASRTVNVVHINPALTHSTPRNNNMFKYREKTAGGIPLTPSPSPIRRSVTHGGGSLGGKMLRLGNLNSKVSPASSTTSSGSSDLLTPDTCTTDEETEYEVSLASRRPRHNSTSTAHPYSKGSPDTIGLHEAASSLTISTPPASNHSIIPLIKLSSVVKASKSHNFLSSIGTTLAGFRKDSSTQPNRGGASAH